MLHRSQLCIAPASPQPPTFWRVAIGCRRAQAAAPKLRGLLLITDPPDYHVKSAVVRCSALLSSLACPVAVSVHVNKQHHPPRRTVVLHAMAASSHRSPMVCAPSPDMQHARHLQFHHSGPFCPSPPNCPLCQCRSCLPCSSRYCPHPSILS